MTTLSSQYTEPVTKPSLLDGTRRHVLDLDDFSSEELELVLGTAEKMREVLGQEIKKITRLRGKIVVTMFYEASTRTRVSFEEAAKIMSADAINVSASGSSVEKGESLLNTALTLQATGADLLVLECGGGPPHMNWDDIHKLRDDLPASTQMLVTHYNGVTAPDVSAIDGLSLAQDFASYEL